MEEKKEQININFSKKEDIQLLEDLTNYKNMVNEYNLKGNKLTITGIIRSLIKDFLNGKVSTKDFIELDKENYYYFNKKELLENRTVKAVPEEPSTDFNNYFTVKKIPNNLDSFNAEAETYSYGNDSSRHKGLYIYYIVNIMGANPVPLVFDFKGNELTVSLIDFSEIEFLVKSEEDVDTVKEIIDSSEKTVEQYRKLIINNPDGVDYIKNPEASIFYSEFVKKVTSVIEDYKGRKAIDLLVKYGVDVLGKSSEERTNININNPIEDLVNSNVAKDKEIRELEEKYKIPLKEIKRTVKELEEMKDKDIIKLWNDLKDKSEN